MATTAISPNDLRCLMGFASLLKNNVYGGFVLSVLTMMLSNFVAVEMTSHQHFLLSCWCYPACIIIDLALPIRVGIFLSATELFWGVPGAVNSKITTRFCFSHSLWRLLFSPLLSNLIFFTSMPYVLINALIHIDIITNWSLFLFRKKLWLQSLNSSTAISQCLFPPMLSCWKELMSINILYPGLLMVLATSSSLVCWFVLSLLVHIFHIDTFLSTFRLCSCGTKPQCSENHHFVMTSSWEPQCHHDIIMRTPRITGKPKFSWSGGL